mmetsp:Transcript_31981/g.94071  ORF Transcript_31981/g.94071 Transcript_31981/m.94071 type:complete len:258 (+) Transcript_31981:3053-3826(+)
MIAILRRSVLREVAMLVPRWQVPRPFQPSHSAVPTPQRQLRRQESVALVAALLAQLLLLQRRPQLHPPLVSALPHHQPLLHRRRYRLLRILRRPPLLLAAALLQHLSRLPVVRRSNSARSMLLPRLQRRSPLASVRQLPHHRQVGFLSRTRRVPAPSRLHLDSVQLPLLRSNLVREGSAPRLPLGQLRLLLRPVALGLLPPSPTSRVLERRPLEELLPPPVVVVDSVLVPLEARTRAANSAAESSEPAGLLVNVAHC